MERKEPSLDKAVLEVLACPKCRGALEYREAESALLCHGCRLRYNVKNGIPIMLIDEAEPF